MIEFITFIIMLAYGQPEEQPEPKPEPVEQVQQQELDTSPISQPKIVERLPQSYPQSYPAHMGIMCETARENPEYRDPAIYCR